MPRSGCALLPNGNCPCFWQDRLASASPASQGRQLGCCMVPVFLFWLLTLLAVPPVFSVPGEKVNPWQAHGPWPTEVCCFWMNFPNGHGRRGSRCDTSWTPGCLTCIGPMAVPGGSPQLGSWRPESSPLRVFFLRTKTIPKTLERPFVGALPRAVGGRKRDRLLF